MEYIAIKTSNYLNNLLGTEGSAGYFGAKLFCFGAAVLTILLVILTRRAWLMYVFAVFMAAWLVIVPFLQSMAFHDEGAGELYSIMWLDREAACALTFFFWVMLLFAGVYKKTGYKEADAIGLVFMIVPTIPTIACVYKCIRAGIYDSIFFLLLIAAVFGWLMFIFAPAKET